MNNDLSIEVKDLVKVYNLYNSSADRLKYSAFEVKNFMIIIML